MKNSKIFYALSTLMLATVGVYATVNATASNSYWYHPASAPTSCISTVVDFDCVIDPAATCKGTDFTSPSLNRQLYATDDCDKILKRS